MSRDIESWVLAHYGTESFHPGLERISAALDFLKNDLSKPKIVIIAGTNGKGETAHRLSNYLRDSTFCTWTSPHIQDISERFSSDQGNISSKELQELILSTHKIVMDEDHKLSFYEFLFLVFCRWSIKRKPEVLILEVGLGGRLDAVNCLNADLVLLTSISRDHQEFLGHRYDQILIEKLGVLRKNSTLLSYLDLHYLRERAQTYSKKIGCSHIDLNDYLDIPPCAFSHRNQFLAYAAFCEIKGLPLQTYDWKPSSDELFGRGEVIKSEHDWYLYGSHNVDGVRKLIQFLRSKNYNFPQRPFDLILTSFSKRSDRDLSAMLRMLKSSQLGEVVVTSFDHPKAYPRTELKEKALQEGLKFVDKVTEVIHGSSHQKILVVGSYYFMGDIKSRLGL